MKKYKVLVRGENFLLNIEGVKQKVGFYVTRFIEAENKDAAEYAVMDLLRKDSNLLKDILNKSSDSPMMYAEEIEELKSFRGYSVRGTGFAFYPEESSPAE